MQHDEINAYVTNHPFSKLICGAFAEGCGAGIKPSPGELCDGDAAVYGILRGCDAIIRECEWRLRDYYHIDHAYVCRSNHYDRDFNGHYRITRNAFQWSGETRYPPDRWNGLGVKIRPWERRGRHIIVAPLSGAVAKFLNIDSVKWLNAVLAEISKHTDRKVYVKQKGRGEIDDFMNDAWMLVTHSSNTAVDALLRGIPVCTLGESAAKPLSTDLCDIESPVYGDREAWCWGLAYNQFTLSEMKDGTAWRILNESRA